MKKLKVLLLVTSLYSLTAMGATVEVSPPFQITSDTFYERGQAIVYDGSDYFLFYGRSTTVTGNYQNDTPDTHDYEVYFKKAASVPGLASATPTKVVSAKSPVNSYLGECGAAYFGGDVWVFATLDADPGSSGSDADLYGWWSGDGGSSWNQVTLPFAGLNDGQAHHDEISFGGKLWILEGAGDFTTRNSASPKSGPWSAAKTVGSLTGGLAKFFVDGADLYVGLYSAGTSYIYHWNSGTETWDLTDSAAMARSYDPTLFKLGSDYVWVNAPLPADFSYQWLEARTSSSLSGLLSSSTPKSVTMGGYGTNTFTEMWPIGFVDNDGDAYIFFTSERDNLDPATEGTGNIWAMEIVWDPGNDHYTWVANAVANAAAGDDISIYNGTYFESNILLDKELSLTGESEAGVLLAPVGEDDNDNSSFGMTYQHCFIVDADNVSISTLTIDGQGNPALTAGKNNYRAGIITQDLANYDATQVTSVSVLNPYYRGIYLRLTDVDGLIDDCTVDNLVAPVYHSYGILTLGDVTISNCSVSNITGDIYARAIGTAYGDIVVSDNFVSNTGDGLYHFNYGYPTKTLTMTGNEVVNAVTGMNLVGMTATTVIGGPAAADQNTIDLVSVKSNAQHQLTAAIDPTLPSPSGLTEPLVSAEKSAGADIGILVWYTNYSATIENNEVTCTAGDAGMWIFHDEDSLNPLIVKDNIFTATASDGTNKGEGTGIFMTDDGDFLGDENGTNYAVLDGNQITGFARGVDLYRNAATPVTGRDVNIEFNNNILHNNGIGLLTNGGRVNSCSNNTFTGSGTAAIQVTTGLVDGKVYGLTENSIFVLGGLSIDNQTGALIDAPGNWYGDATPSVVATKVSSDVDYSPWLGSGTDVADPGFQSDFLTLWVDDDSPQAAAATVIQEGVDLAPGGGTVHVADGTYEEQVEIAKDLSLIGQSRAGTILQSPTSLTAYFNSGGGDNYPILYAHDADAISLSGMTVDGLGRGNTNYRFVGVGMSNAGGSIADMTVQNIEDAPFSGSQHGLGVFVTAYDPPARAVAVTNCTVTEFQKNGITGLGSYLTLDVTDCDVTGEGPTPTIAQNALQYGSGAGGNATNCQLADVAYTGATWTSTGFLVQSDGTVVAENIDISGCQTSVYWIDGSGSFSNGSITSPAGGDGFYAYSSSGSKSATQPRRLSQGIDPGYVPATKATNNVLLSATVLTGVDLTDSWGVGAFAAGGGDVTLTIEECEISHWDYNIAAYDYGDPVHLTVYNNSLTDAGTWNLWSNLAAQTVDASGNWYGIATAAGVAALIDGDVDYTPWLADGTDQSGAAGFQGDFSELWVDDDSPQVGAVTRIQEGVDRVTGSTVNVAPGSYEEQVVITKDDLNLLGAGFGTDPNLNTIVTSPVSLAYFFSTGNNNYPVIGIDGATGVTIDNIRLDGAGRANGNYRFVGIGFWNADGTVSNSVITGIIETPFTGSQHGNGIYAYNNTGGPYTIDVVNCTIDNFQKNGITLLGTGLTANVTNCTVTGASATATIAQNGIQLGYGSGGTITDCNVAGYTYTPATYYSTGILLYEGTSVDITGTDIDDAQASIYYLNTSGTIDDCTITNPTAEGVFIDAYSAKSNGSRGLAPDAMLEAGFTDFSRAAVVVDITDTDFLGANLPGIAGLYPWPEDDLTLNVTGCIFSDWDTGMFFEDQGGVFTVTANGNTFLGNLTGIESTTSAPVDATCNWWGDISGPFHATTNPSGLGDPTTDNVTYQPWSNDDFSSCTFTSGPLEVWVDDDYTGGGGAGGHTFGYDAFDKVADAVFAVGDGGIVHVAEGTYNEADIEINKQMTLTGVVDATCPGAGANAPVMDGTGLGQHARCFKLAAGIDNVTIEGFNIQNYGTAPGTGGGACGIWAYGNDADPMTNITIRNNRFDAVIWAAIFFFNDGQSAFDNIQISCNDVNMGTWSSNTNVYGIECTNCQNSTVADNDISGGFTGILVTAQGRTDPAVVSNIQILNNTVSGSVGYTGNIGLNSWNDGQSAHIENITLNGNTVKDATDVGFGSFGIRCYASGGTFAGPVTVNGNAFSNNGVAIDNGTTVMWNAEENWFGDKSGPLHSTTNSTATGDEVSDNVDYSPWWGFNYVGNAHTGGWYRGVNTSNGSGIQEGVDVSSATVRDTIVANEGTYVERVNFLGKNVLVGSRYLLDNDLAHLQATTIDADPNILGFSTEGSAVSFKNGEGALARLLGFTIRNGIGTHTSVRANSRGGGIYCEGSTPLVQRCVIHSNTAAGGGAIACVDASPTFDFITMSANDAALGSGVYCSNSSPVFSNSVISFNLDGEAVYCDDGASSPTFSCSDIFGNDGGDWIGCIAGQASMANNLRTNPLFCDADAADYTISDISPLAVGNNPCSQLIGALDVACTGGYLCGDVEPSGAVTISDAVYIVNYIFGGGPAPNPLQAGDVDCSGGVSITDAVYIVNYIFGGGPVPCANCP